MTYRFATERANYEDFASGRVLYNHPGMTAFPVRLAAELYERARATLISMGINPPFSLYDPCCGGGYLLTTLGFLYHSDIASISASDIDGEAVQLAKKNLSLLTQEGLNQRMGELQRLVFEYGKPSHAEALDSTYRLMAMVTDRGRSIEIDCFQADALNPGDARPKVQPNMVITDLPYGDLVHWSADSPNAAKALLDGLLPLLDPPSVMLVVANKSQVVKHPSYIRLEQFQVGKRRITLLRRSLWSGE